MKVEVLGDRRVLLAASLRGYETLCEFITVGRRAAEKGEYRLAPGEARGFGGTHRFAEGVKGARADVAVDDTDTSQNQWPEMLLEDAVRRPGVDALRAAWPGGSCWSIPRPLR